ncbi:MAG: biopolymer transporter ExbD [Lentisphaerae bacterium]|nr:biopolymer transporter ExbD [Lentisphaerota bacterium]
MASNNYQRERLVSGLRTRFFPKSRIGHGLISLAPWLNIAVLLFMFISLDGKFVTQHQGMVVELPEMPFRNGSRSGLIVVVLSVEKPGGIGREETVFFDDARYMVKSVEDMEKLKTAFIAGNKRHPDADLVVKADKNVQYGTIMLLCEMAQSVGIKNINLASRSAMQEEASRSQ